MKIISQAPTRICLIGGGTDVNPYASKYQGAIINVAINLFNRVVLTPRNDKQIIINALGKRREFILGNKLKYGKDKDFDIVRAIINYFQKKIPSGFDLKITSETPDSCGLGTSGSIEVALIGCFKRWLGEKIDKDRVARLAFELESEELGWHTGKQDQWAAAFAGLNLVTFGKGEKVKVEPIKLKKDLLRKFQRWIVLYYTGGQRASSEMQVHLKKSMKESDRLKAFDKLKKITFLAFDYLKEGDFEHLGKLFDIGWLTKKKTNPLVTNKRLDRIYKLARESGALGGKLIGAGGAGYYFFLCPPEKQKKLETVLKKEKTYFTKFKFDFKGLQTKILK